MGKETSNLQSGSQTVLEEIQSRAVKYEVAISIFKNKVVYINGPFRGGEHDLTMLRKGNLLNLIVDGKLAATDLGYKTGIAAERAKLSLPNAHDSKHLNNFKSWARLRQETLGALSFSMCCRKHFDMALISTSSYSKLSQSLSNTKWTMALLFLVSN
jgi:hypothetical protein